MTLDEADEAIEEHDRNLERTSGRIDALRRSIRASLDGDHDRASRLLDTLDDERPSHD